MSIGTSHTDSNGVFQSISRLGIDDPVSLGGREASADENLGGFAGALARAGGIAGGAAGIDMQGGLAGGGPARAEADRGRLLAEATEKISRLSERLIATTFFQPLLAQARDDPFKSDLMHGGFGEDAFGGRLDSIIADRMASRSALPAAQKLTDSYTAWLQNQPTDRLKQVAYMSEDIFG